MPDIERWQATWKGLGVESLEADLYAAVTARYAESHRSYHTLQHLDECFVNFDEARHLADQVHGVELALWFHDAVYEVRSQDNEEQSASWARDAAIEQGVASSVAERVHRLVLATKHNARPPSPDAALLVDVDLAILGAAVERFDEYERQVLRSIRGCPACCFGASDVRFWRRSWRGHTSTAPITSGRATRCLPGPTSLDQSNDLEADNLLARRDRRDNAGWPRQPSRP